MASQISCNLVFAIMASGFGSGFQHGYHGGVVNLPEQVFRDWENSTHQQTYTSYFDKDMGNTVWGISVSIMNIGGTLGGLSTGFCTRRFGPRLSLIFNNIIGIIACILMSFVSYGITRLETFIIGRFLVGINCGLNAGLCPMYLSEIAPVKIRGAVGSVYQLVITISILLAMVFGLQQLLGTPTMWQYLFVIPIVVGIFQIISLAFCAESPRYLLSEKGDQEKAEAALKWFRKTDNVSEEMAVLKSEDEANKALPKVTLKDMFKEKQLKTPLMISVMLMLAQQFSGINVIIFYSTSSFVSSGLSPQNSQYATLCVSVVNVLMTVVSMWLVDIAGRKTLLMVGFGGMAIDTALIAVALMFASWDQIVGYICVMLVVMFIILFAAGAGSIPWFIVSEMFNQAARPTAVSLAVPTNWFANFVVTMMFPPLTGLMDSSVFFIFTGLNVLFFVFILFKVPETKGRTIEDITSSFK